ncbi:MAG TPA: hypothetical protein VLY24_07425 [Bryobacteraceae bacterium]|nr:hypothetical protein [Bryobacteraceae bacterium]
MTPPFQPPSLPPATAEYVHTVQSLKPGVPPQQMASRMFRSGDGKTRIDTGNTSVISNPAAGQNILLDHTAKTAHIIPTPPAAPALPGQPPAMPGMPGFAPPGAPSTPPVNVKDLGKSMMHGVEVEGKQFTYPPPTVPQAPAAPAAPGMPAAPAVPGMPAMPKIPGAPALPGMPAAGTPPGMPAKPAVPGMPAAPAAPGAPGAPAAPAIPGMPPVPKAPTVAEVWTSTKMHIPMLTKTSGPLAQTTSQCHNAIPGEPHPSLFQIPAGYKMI